MFMIECYHLSQMVSPEYVKQAIQRINHPSPRRLVPFVMCFSSVWLLEVKPQLLNRFALAFILYWLLLYIDYYCYIDLLLYWFTVSALMQVQSGPEVLAMLGEKKTMELKK